MISLSQKTFPLKHTTNTFQLVTFLHTKPFIHFAKYYFKNAKIFYQVQKRPWSQIGLIYISWLSINHNSLNTTFFQTSSCTTKYQLHNKTRNEYDRIAVIKEYHSVVVLPCHPPHKAAKRACVLHYFTLLFSKKLFSMKD